MLCPNDGTTELVAATLSHVEVHDCPMCEGMWFERDELNRAKDGTDEWVRWIDPDVFAAAQADGATTTAKKCAQCGEPMRTLLYPESDVRIEVCVTDHGVWLDKGEFDKILRELDQLTNSMSESDYEQATEEQLKDIVRPHESRWAEFKDFFTVFKLMEMRVGTEHPAMARAIEVLARTGI